MQWQYKTYGNCGSKKTMTYESLEFQYWYLEIEKKNLILAALFSNIDWN